MLVLFPEDYFRKGQPDEIFVLQYEAFMSIGIECATINLEQLDAMSTKARIPKGERVLYRGWMLTEGEYASLVSVIERSGAQPMVTCAQYLATHHLPNWYTRISDLTAETVVFPPDVTLVEEIKKLGWGKCFIKDFVKSVKTGVRSVVNSPEQAAEIVEQMIQFRGGIEGGICVRKFEDFLPDSESRFFVARGKVYSADECHGIPAIVEECASRIESPFFSVDLALRSDGVERVVEVGDGQVSDLVGWKPDRMAGILKRLAQ